MANQGMYQTVDPESIRPDYKYDPFSQGRAGVIDFDRKQELRAIQDANLARTQRMYGLDEAVYGQGQQGRLDTATLANMNAASGIDQQPGAAALAKTGVQDKQRQADQNAVMELLGGIADDVEQDPEGAEQAYSRVASLVNKPGYERYKNALADMGVNFGTWDAPGAAGGKMKSFQSAMKSIRDRSKPGMLETKIAGELAKTGKVVDGKQSVAETKAEADLAGKELAAVSASELQRKKLASQEKIAEMNAEIRKAIASARGANQKEVAAKNRNIQQKLMALVDEGSLSMEAAMQGYADMTSNINQAVTASKGVSTEALTGGAIKAPVQKPIVLPTTKQPATLTVTKPTTKELSPKDQAAIKWLRDNPNDPDAPAVRKRLGL